jgi:hypothetical protein
MGVRNFLVDGVSGVGKTAVANELHRRGFQAIHGDRELAYKGDPDTGLPVAPPAGGPTASWFSEHHIWDLEKVKAYIASQDVPVTFFCGSSRNRSKFIHLLDGVFILEVDRETMEQRIDERVARDPTDFGGTLDERDVIARMFETREAFPTAATPIHAVDPITQVVDAILSKSGINDDEVAGQGGPEVR